VLQSLGVVWTKVFNVGDCIPMWLKNVHRLSEGRSVRTRKDPLSNPAAENAVVTSADEVKEPTTGITNGTMNDLSQARVVGNINVLQHSY
jgi:hypothetical protein